MASKKMQLEGADFFTAPAPKKTTTKTAQAQQPAAAQATPPAQRTGSVTTCFKVDATLLAKLKAVAYWDRRKIKDVLEFALEDYLAKYEAEHGPIDTNIPRNLA